MTKPLDVGGGILSNRKCIQNYNVTQMQMYLLDTNVVETVPWNNMILDLVIKNICLVLSYLISIFLNNTRGRQRYTFYQ